jgi:hypothetical protein
MANAVGCNFTIHETPHEEPDQFEEGLGKAECSPSKIAFLLGDDSRWLIGLRNCSAHVDSFKWIVSGADRRGGYSIERCWIAARNARIHHRNGRRRPTRVSSGCFFLILVLAIAPLALAAAFNPSFRVAPFSAVLVLLISGQLNEGPVESALYRTFEVALGGAIAVHY